MPSWYIQLFEVGIIIAVIIMFGKRIWDMIQRKRGTGSKLKWDDPFKE